MEAEDVAARDGAYRVERTLIIPAIGGFLRHEAVVGTLARPHTHRRREKRRGCGAKRGGGGFAGSLWWASRVCGCSRQVCAPAPARPLLRCLTLDSSWSSSSSSSSSSAQRCPVPSSQEECLHMYIHMYVHTYTGDETTATPALQKPAATRPRARSCRSPVDGEVNTAYRQYRSVVTVLGLLVCDCGLQPSPLAHRHPSFNASHTGQSHVAHARHHLPRSNSSKPCIARSGRRRWPVATTIQDCGEAGFSSPAPP